MTLVGAPSARLPAVTARRSLAVGVLVPIATIVAIVAIAVLPLLTPPVLHVLLDAAEAHAWLGVTPEVAHQLSDATVAELVWGPGGFTLAGPDGAPLYGLDEASHLRDARALLWLLLAAGGAAIGGIVVALATRRDRAAVWRAIARGGALAAAGTLLLGILGLVAFGPLFEAFHRLAFPGGNWAFDASQRLVQLYPYAFWQLAAGALGALVVVLGMLTWLGGRLAARHSG